MNKVGDCFEERQTKKKVRSEDLQDSEFDKIIDTLDDYMNRPSMDDKISTRVKLLIKNMFANKDNGWDKTKEINKAGAKTKLSV